MGKKKNDARVRRFFELLNMMPNGLPEFKPLVLHDLMELSKDFSIILPDKFNKFNIVIYKDFRFDGVSIPRIAWATTGTPFSPRHILPGVVHDHLYKSGLTGRKRADKIYRYLLMMCGVNLYQRNKQYGALRLLGWRAWRKHRKADGTLN